MVLEYAVKATRSGSFVVPCCLEGHVTIFALLVHAQRFAGTLSDEVRIKLFGDTGYRYLVEDGDLFAGDFLNRLPKAAKMVNFDWPEFQQSTKSAAELGLPLNPVDLIRVHQQARQDYTAWAIENGHGDILATLAKLNERCGDLSPIYDKTYGRGRSKRSGERSAKSEAAPASPSAPTPISLDQLEPLVAKILEKLLPKMVQPLIDHAVERALDEGPYMNGHDDGEETDKEEFF